MKRRNPVKEKNYGLSMTKQEPAAEANINNIVARYFRTGYLPENNKTPKFGDFTGPGFQDMRNAIADIDLQFNMLPAKLRKRFNNDPYHLIRYVEDPANKEEAAKLGLIKLLDPDGDPFVPDEPVTPLATGEKLDELLKRNDELLAEMRKSDPEANPRKRKELEGD